MRRLKFSFLLLLLLGELVFPQVRIKPDHAYLQYTGRIDFSDPEAPVFFWHGTSVRANFQGNTLAIILDDSLGASYYNVFVDSDFSHPLVIDCDTGKQVYSFPSRLKDGSHQLLIFRRTEASTGPTRFLGLLLGETGKLLPPPAPPSRRLEFYGNSITCGMGNEAPDDAPDNNLAEENNFLSYAAITARNLEAEYVCIAKSGIGILISWFDLVMPDYYYRLNPDDPGSRWDFSRYVPDVVVINLFQNDSWLINRLHPVPDSTTIVHAYADFVRKVRREYPRAFIVCTLGSMDAVAPGSPWPGYIEQAVRLLRDQDRDRNLAIYFFPFTGWRKHPRVRHHRVMADSLTAFLRRTLHW